MNSAPGLDASKTRITVFQMAVMTTITVASLRSLPAMAAYGWASILLWLIPAALFFVPTALIAAELSASVPGGVYEWIKEALGQRWALVAVWVQWTHNIVWYPAQLAMIAGAAAYFVNLSGLANSGIYTAIVIVVVFWWAVWVGMHGGNLFAKIASRAGLIGTIIPAGILVALGIAWLVTGQHEPNNALEGTNLLPPLAGPASVALIVSNFLAFAGMEMNAVHASHLPRPRRDFTRVIGIAFAGTLGIFIVPTLIMSMVLSGDKSHTADGVMVAFSKFFAAFHVPWLGNVVYLLIVFGGIASIVTWISGPSRILYHAAKDDALPAFFHKTNKNDAQSGIYIIMGIVVTILACLYIVFPDNVSDVFSVLVGMAVALYLTMYMFMFVSAIILRKTKKSGMEGYRAPGLYIVAVIGIVASFAAFVMTFIPQAGQKGIPHALYPVIVAVFFVVLAAPSLILYRMARQQKVVADAASTDAADADADSTDSTDDGQVSP
ncbi:MAG: APC family permease [Cellulomonadaceae bacterium]|jgi:amino acid transporter|nr:APC family permease [Cellulomonadaceae bacterium]